MARPTLAMDIAAFLQQEKLEPASVDLMIDLESVATWQLFVVVSTVIAQLGALPQINAWRTLTVVASSFPQLGGLQGTHTVDRTEWHAWLSLQAQRQRLPRLPTFGDYAIQSPVSIDGYDPRIMPLSPAIRYTLDKEWLIIRGSSSRLQRLATQYPMLAAQLTSDPRFYGAKHCGGCRDAVACASGTPGFGAPEGWRRIGTLHHLTVATAQIAAVAFP